MVGGWRLKILNDCNQSQRLSGELQKLRHQRASITHNLSKLGAGVVIRDPAENLQKLGQILLGRIGCGRRRSFVRPYLKRPAIIL